MVATNQIKNFENQTYSWVTNRSPCPYSHGLDDQALQSTLTSLVVRGLLQHKTGPLWRIERRSYVKGDLYAMTEAGGKL
jgi:hypothetical protein